MTPKKKIIATLFFTTILLALIVLTAPLPQKNTALVEEFWITKTHSYSNNNIVFGGDSRVYRGISPQDFNATFDSTLTSYNFGYSSGGFSGEYLNFLEEKLDKTSNKKIIILGISPHSLTPIAFKNEQLNGYMKISGFDKFEGLYLTQFQKYFAPYKPDEILNLTDTKIENEYFHEMFKDGGWAPVDVKPLDSMKSIPVYQKIFDNNQVNYIILENLFSQIYDWTQQGISVYGFRPPTTITMQSIEDSLSGYNETFIKSNFEMNGGIWIDIDQSKYQTYDGNHLTPESAIEFSRDLGILVRCMVDPTASHFHKLNL